MIPLKKTLLAAGLLALSTGMASAFPAVVENDLNLRAGPGTGYHVIDVMPGGAAVQAGNCYGGWCRVNYGGRTGYASRSYLDIGRAGDWRRGYRSYAYAPGYGAYAYEPWPLRAPFWPWNW